MLVFLFRINKNNLDVSLRFDTFALLKIILNKNRCAKNYFNPIAFN